VRARLVFQTEAVCSSVYDQRVTTRFPAGKENFNGALIGSPLKNSEFQSQRDCVLQPKVEASALPWVTNISRTQPQRGCGQSKFNPKPPARPHPCCGWIFVGRTTQGSSFLATLGFETESRWDTWMLRIEFNDPLHPLVDIESAKRSSAGSEIRPYPALAIRTYRSPFCRCLLDAAFHSNNADAPAFLSLTETTR
jgi:hypothetical protein